MFPLSKDLPNNFLTTHLVIRSISGAIISHCGCLSHFNHIKYLVPVHTGVVTSVTRDADTGQCLVIGWDQVTTGHSVTLSQLSHGDHNQHIFTAWVESGWQATVCVACGVWWEIPEWYVVNMALGWVSTMSVPSSASVHRYNTDEMFGPHIIMHEKHIITQNLQSSHLLYLHSFTSETQWTWIKRLKATSVPCIVREL